MSDEPESTNLNAISAQTWATLLSKRYGFDYDSTVEYLNVIEKANDELDERAPHMPYRAQSDAMMAVLATELGSVAAQLPENLRSKTLHPRDMREYMELSAIVQHLSKYPMPLGDTSFMCEVTDVLIECINGDRNKLVNTGLPSVVPVNGSYVSVLGSLVYPSKLPLMTKERPRDGRVSTIRYFWDRCPDVPARIVTGPFGSHIRVTGRAIQYSQDGTGYDLDGKKIIAPTYEEAFCNTELSPCQVGILPALREQLIPLKLAVLTILRDCLSRQSVSELWPRCLDVLTSTLCANRIDFLLMVDSHYLKLETRLTLRNMWYPEPVNWGGLRELLQIIGLYERELKLDHSLSKEKYLMKYIAEDRNGRRFFSFNTLGDVLRHPEAERLKPALLSLHRMFGEELLFWEEFDKRAEAALNSEFYEPIALTHMVKRGVSEEFRNSMERYGSALQNNLESDLELKKLDPTRMNSEASASKSPFHEIRDLKWEEITITFVSHHSVSIAARSVSETYTYAELGFADGRSVDKPNTRWVVLKTMAKRGEISYSVDIEQTTRDTAKAAMKDIRKLLRVAIGLEDDPFHKYRKVNAYRPKFQLVDASYSNGA
ncbi:MAG: hypothetical protein KOO62_12330 [candidate division Zixibacteria bacterium]|nr:hypothetical protein [candidate division Zixibacteria bacterium]